MAVKTTIQVRRDTAANWNAANPILAAGEIGYETDTKYFKIGDGTTKWNGAANDGVNKLPYQNTTGPQGIQGPKGDTGATGQGFLWRGAWATSTSYAIYDVVRQDGSSYRCSTAHTSSSTTQPGIGASWTSYWSLMAQKGDAGLNGNNGNDGATGRGITSITRTSGTGAAGTTDTFTITYSDSTTSTFNVYNGSNGTNGNNGSDGRGISSITRTSGTGAAGTTDTYTITYTSGSPSTFNVVNGANGAAGRGITSIVRTSGTGAAGTTDTYTITYSDSSTSTYNVVNGANGAGGAAGAGFDGITSSSSLSVSTGSKTITVNKVGALVQGTRIRVTSTATPTIYLEGVITTISSLSITFTADNTSGTGTLSSWNITVAGDKGQSVSAEYVQLATGTVSYSGGPTTNATLASGLVSTGYRKLVIVLFGTNAGTGAFSIKLNSTATTTSYQYTYHNYGDTTTVVTGVNFTTNTSTTTTIPKFATQGSGSAYNIGNNGNINTGEVVTLEIFEPGLNLSTKPVKWLNGGGYGFGSNASIQDPITAIYYSSTTTTPAFTWTVYGVK